MVTVKLKGVNAVRDKRTGEIRYYLGREKGAVRIHGEKGSAEFIASYQEALANRRPTETGKIRGLVTLYKASPEYNDLADSTRRQRARWLDKITIYYGDFPIAAFDRHDRIKPIIRKWRNQYRDTPRTADYAVQVLSALLSFGVNEGRLGANPCIGLKQLYDSDRADIVWSETDIERMTKTAPPWLARMILLAVNTGLRRGDLLKLCWSHIGSDEIEIRTGKSRDKIKALIPLHADLETVLASIPKRGPLVLTYDDSRRPVTANGFTSAWRRAWADAGMGDADLHFNDLRGTAITRLYLAEFSEREIAEIVGWTEESVKRIIHRYVGRAAAVRNRIERINQIKKGTDFAK